MEYILAAVLSIPLYWYLWYRYKLSKKRKAEAIAEVKRKALEAKEEARRLEIQSKFGSSAFLPYILEGSVVKGMNKNMVVASIGRPKDIKKEVLKTKTKEAWKYSSREINFEDDTVIGWKN